MNDDTPSVRVEINGEGREVSIGLSLTGLIAGLGLPPETALVELNGQALLRSEWPQMRLAEGDRLEILRVVAGG